MSESFDNGGGGNRRQRSRGAGSGTGRAAGPPDYAREPPLSYAEVARQAGVRLEGPATAPPAFSEPDPRLDAPTGPPPHLDVEDLEPGRTGDLASAPIVQAGSVTGRSLTVVIAIMCFLACLTAGAVWMMYQSANAWLANMSNEITIQVEPVDNADTDQRVQEIVSFLRLRGGISTVNPLDQADTGKLLEPWLGSSEALKDLPVPRLIAIEIDRRAPPDLVRLGAELKEQFPNAVLDDHRQWRKQIATVSNTFMVGGVAILVLVALATIGTIISATGSAMAANRDIVEVLNFVGADDSFIAHEFEKHFLSLGIRAGLIGAGLAVLVFWTLPIVMELLGGSSVGIDELHRLVGIGALDMFGYLILAIVVVLVAALCTITSHIGVKRILNQQN